MKLDFDPVEHRYSVEDVTVPSVTQLLDIYWPDGNVAFYKEEHAARGRRVHALTQEIDAGVAPFEPEFQGYLDAYKAFLSDKNPTFLFSEHAVFSVRYWYAGTLDRFGIMDDLTGVFDWKTGRAKARHALQLAGYAFALNPSSPADHGWVVELRDNGKYKITDYDLVDELVAWQGMVRYHRYRRRHDKGVI